MDMGDKKMMDKLQKRVLNNIAKEAIKLMSKDDKLMKALQVETHTWKDDKIQYVVSCNAFDTKKAAIEYANKCLKQLLPQYIEKVIARMN
jgi:hypothetical protein